MTYLEVINNVLRRLREPTVSDITENTYSTMVGDFVNDAKKFCEDSWDWSALRNTLTVTTSSGVFNYVLVGSQNKIKILDALNDTKNWFLTYQTQHWFNDKYLVQSPEEGSPRYYTFNGVDSNGDTQIDLYPKPNAVETLRFNVVKREGDLSANTDDLLIPSMPVIHLSIAFLSRERGETGGTTTQEYFTLANKYLQDAIALDAQKHPEETIWYTP
jgi:hypothetical protein